LGDEPTQHRDVLVVDLGDLLAAVWAGLAPGRSRQALSVAPANRPSTLLCHLGASDSVACASERYVVLRRSRGRWRRFEVAGVDRNVALRGLDVAGEPVPVPATGIIAPAEELDGISDDIDGRAILAI